MLETSNSFDAAIVTAICITAVLKEQNSYSGKILTHIIKTDETKLVSFEPGTVLETEQGLHVALRKTFDIGNGRTNPEKETYRKSYTLGLLNYLDFMISPFITSRPLK